MVLCHSGRKFFFSSEGYCWGTVVPPTNEATKQPITRTLTKTRQHHAGTSLVDGGVQIGTSGSVVAAKKEPTLLPNYVTD